MEEELRSNATNNLRGNGEQTEGDTHTVTVYRDLT